MRRAYPQYAIIWFGIDYHSQSFHRLLLFSCTFSLIITLFLNNTNQYIRQNICSSVHKLLIIIHSKISFLAITARHQLVVRSIGCFHLHNGCHLHYDTADSVLTSGCSLISQLIWNKVFIRLVILGICIKIEKLCVGKSRRWKCISRWYIVDLGTSSSLLVTRWHRWHFGQRWRQSCGWLSVSVCLRFTCSFASPLYLQTLWCRIVARKVAVCVVVMKHSRVSFHRSFHLAIPRKLNSPLLLYSNVRIRLDE